MSVETLDRLTTIIDGLTPLGDAGPGEPVVAADWNTLVGAVAELARIAVARERTAEELLAASFARVEHDHRGELDLGWFDAETRAFLEGQRDNRTDLASELGRTRRDLDSALAKLDDFSLALDAVKAQIDDVDDRDRDRSRGIDRLADRVEVLGDNASSIADLRTTFTGIDDRVGEALALREELMDPQGNRIDLAQLRADANVALELRENLTTTDGQLAQYRDFERRIAAIEDVTVHDDDGGGGPFDPVGFRESILAEAALANEPRFGSLEENIGGFESSVDELTTGLATARGTVADHGRSIDALQTTSSGVAALTLRMNNVEGRVNSHGSQLTVLNPMLGRMATAEGRLKLLDELDARLGVVASDLGKVTERVGQLDGLDPRLRELERLNLATVVARVDGINTTAGRAHELAQGNRDQIETLGAVSDERGAQLNRLATLADANRQTLKLVTGDVSDIRNRFGRIGDTDITRPPIGGGTIGRGGGVG